jgi:hypothetical protein
MRRRPLLCCSSFSAFWLASEVSISSSANCILHLIAIKPLRPLAKLRTLELLQQMAELIVGSFAPPADGSPQWRRRARSSAGSQRPECIETIRQSIDRHAKDRSRFAPVVIRNRLPDSIRRNSQHVAVGDGMDWSCKHARDVTASQLAALVVFE